MLEGRVNMEGKTVSNDKEQLYVGSTPTPGFSE
jgi:hypothetical protein